MTKAESVDKTGEKSTVVSSSPSRRHRGLAIFDLVLRIFALGGTLGSAAAMGTSDQTLPFTTQFFRFNARYRDFQAFKLFVVVNSIVCGYLAISLPSSISLIVRKQSTGKTRVVLIFLDATMMALLAGAASAAAAIVYLAHNGNSSANWFAICLQFQDFCQDSSGALVGSFGAIVSFVLLILLSSVALSRR